MNVDGRVAVLVNSYADQLGRLDLEVDVAGKKLKSANWKKIPITASLTPAPDVERLVNMWESKVTGIVDVPIGESTKAMARTDPDLRKLIEKAMAEQTGADIAWINTGNIRDNLPAGRILARNIWNILPFDNYLVTGKFKGSRLPKAITDRYPVEPGREYTVTTTDFIADNPGLARSTRCQRSPGSQDRPIATRRGDRVDQKEGPDPLTGPPHELPINTPVANTSRPPSPTCIAAESGGVSI